MLEIMLNFICANSPNHGGYEWDYYPYFADKKTKKVYESNQLVCGCGEIDASCF